MNREEYFICLENYLKNMSIEDREEAIEYYQDYFDAAGVENEQEVIRKLGSPKELAETIMNAENTFGDFDSYYGYSKSNIFKSNISLENAYENNAYENNTANNNDNKKNSNSDNRYNQNGYEGNKYNSEYNNKSNNEYNNEYDNELKDSTSKDNVMNIVVAIIILIIMLPTIITVSGVIIGILFGLGLGGVALMLISVISLFWGISLLFNCFSLGLTIIGGSIMMSGIGLFMVWLLYIICKHLIPALIELVGKLCNWIAGKENK